MSNYPWELLDARKELYQAILNGEIPRAFGLLDHHFPSISRCPSHKTMFKLRCQEFIEIVRSCSIIQAIEFAQRHIKPMHSLYPEETIEVSSLIAYPDPFHSCSRYLLSQDRRQHLADEVNRVILEWCHFATESALERVSKQDVLVRNEWENSKQQEMKVDEEIESREDEKMSL
ncbi:Ran-binding protein 9 [Apophysomyces ossiformis]|uniref:Ran-binding protein 9 n=1 Tax=Apophysomyces ossiformis TaxID=679940 RepID=A0A8H7BXL6_9FUNG|nr:Ran-binding protein 9 [Apophysomyces ossiformis]